MKLRAKRLLAGLTGMSAASMVMAHGGHVPAPDEATHGLLHAISGWQGILALLAIVAAGAASGIALRRHKASRRNRDR